MAVDPTGLIQWTPSNDQCGTTQPVTICASTLYDGDCSQATVNFTVNVAAQQNQNGQQTTSVAQNQKPWIAQPAPNTVYNLQCGQPFNLQVSARDAENNRIYYSVNDNPYTLSVNQNGLVQWTPTSSNCGQTYYPVLCVYDSGSETRPDRSCSKVILNVSSQYSQNQQGNATASESANNNTSTTQIKSVNQPPYFVETNADTASWYAGSNAEIYFTAQDPDGDKLAFTVETQLSNLASFAKDNRLTVKWTPPASFGNYSLPLKVCVTDGIANHKQCITKYISLVGNNASNNSSFYTYADLKIPWSFSFNVFGANRTNDVLYLQRLLNYLGYTVSISGYGSPGNEVDSFGAQTKQALSKFQSENNLSATGNLDQATKAALNNILSSLKTGGEEDDSDDFSSDEPVASFWDGIDTMLMAIDAGGMVVPDPAVVIPVTGALVIKKTVNGISYVTKNSKAIRFGVKYGGKVFEISDEAFSGVLKLENRIKNAKIAQFKAGFEAESEIFVNKIKLNNLLCIECSGKIGRRTMDGILKNSVKIGNATLQAGDVIEIKNYTKVESLYNGIRTNGKLIPQLLDYSKFAADSGNKVYMIFAKSLPDTAINALKRTLTTRGISNIEIINGL